MHTLLTVTLALAGAVTFVGGWRRYVARRRRERHGARGLRRWPAAALLVSGGLLILLPDVLAGLIVPTDEASSAVTAFWFLVGLVYRVIMVVVMAVALLALSLFSDSVLGPMQQWRARWSRAPENVQARALRRTAVGRGLPRDPATLVAYELALSERIMRYQRDAEAAYDRPALADLGDARTARAVTAMFTAESLRPDQPLYVRHDLLATDYGRAVAELAEAVQEAEEHADRAVASSLTDTERGALDEAARTLEFMQRHATSPAERAAAYDRVIAALDAAREHHPDRANSVESPSRSHPWLDVPDRADLSHGARPGDHTRTH